MKKILFTAVITLFIASCSSDTETAPVETELVVEITEATTETCSTGRTRGTGDDREKCIDGVWELSPPPTTTEVSYLITQETHFAIKACIDDIDDLFRIRYLHLELYDYKDVTHSQEIMNLCDTALLRLEIEDAPLGPNPIRKLASAIAGINVILSVANVETFYSVPNITEDNFDTPLYGKVKEVEALLGEVLQ